MKNQNLLDKVLKFFHRFGRFDLREKVFLVYLIFLLVALLVCPVVNVTSLRGGATSRNFWIFWSGEYVGTMLVVLISLVILIGWNLSVRFKNFFSTYFGGKENDSLINFLFLFIIITVFLSIKNTVNIASSATSTISFTGGGVLILVLLLVGIIYSLISVFKGAQRTGKKTRIINVVDEEHNQLESTKQDIKKGLFNDDEVEN